MAVSPATDSWIVQQHLQRIIKRFKVKHSLEPVNISDLFNLKNTQYNLRNSDFELQRFKTVRFGRNTINYMGPLIWSKLPRHLRMIETLTSFKRNIRKVDLSTLVNI